MKRLYLLVSLLSIALLPLKAQSGRGKSLVEATAGFGNLYYGRSYDHHFPPLMLSYEYALLTDAFNVSGLSVGTGITAGYTGASTLTQYGKAELLSEVSEGILALRVAGYYQPIPSRLDMYAVVLLGWGIAESDNSWSGDADAIAMAKTLGWGQKEKVGGPMLGILAGVRYWFTDHWGANAEIGYAPAFLNIGGCVAW